jgi:exonuclease III
MKKIQIIITIIAVLSMVSHIKAQNFNNLQFGTDYTLDIVTWNTEWFPANGSTTVNYVKEIVDALDADIIAFQEIDSKTQFQNLINRLDDYDGYYISNDSYQGLAYLYHKDKIQILDQYEIYTSDWTEFPRSPLIMEFRFENKDYVIINNHLKCCGDGNLDISNSNDEESRRYWACRMLDSYIEDYFDNDRVILVGDLNDELTDRHEDNVFRTFLNDEDHYLFVDMEIAEGSSSNFSYPTWPSHLDHIMISNELFDVFNEPASKCRTIMVDEFFSSWNSYENNVSDHRPVGLKLQTKEIGIEETDYNTLSIYPNPINNNFIINSNQNFDQVRVFNGKACLIFEGSSNETINSSEWDSGIYFVQILKNSEGIFTQKILKL